MRKVGTRRSLLRRGFGRRCSVRSLALIPQWLRVPAIRSIQSRSSPHPRRQRQGMSVTPQTFGCSVLSDGAAVEKIVHAGNTLSPSIGWVSDVDLRN